jgi:hypothetical protein
MKKKIKTKYIMRKYRFIEIDTWKSVKKEGLVARFMKDKHHSIEAVNEDEALKQWWAKYQYGKMHPSYVKERLKVGKYNVVLFTRSRGSRSSAWSRGGVVVQKMVMIEFT